MLPQLHVRVQLHVCKQRNIDGGKTSLQTPVRCFGV